MAINPERIPGEPVRLVLPPTGSVVVCLEDADGTPWSASTWLFLFPVEPDPARPGDTLRGRRDMRYALADRVVFDHVGIGLSLLAQCWDEDLDEYVEVSGPGPAAPGEEVVMTLRRPGARHSVAGRLLGPDGAPAGWRHVELRFAREGADPGGGPEAIRFTTDREDGFRAALSCESPFLVLGAATLLAGGSQDPTCRAELGDVRTRRGETTELGDVRLQLLPTLARGRVVDDRGEPFYWACVRTHRKMSLQSTPWTAADGERHTWWPMNDLQVQTDRDGRFATRGTLEAGTYVLVASADGYLDSAPLPFVPGDDGLELVLRAEGALAGIALVDEGIPAPWLIVEVEPPAGGVPSSIPGREDPVRRVRCREDGSFHVPHLAPGSSSVRIRAWNESDPLRELEGVPIAPGGTSTDPRLQPLDLRQLLRRIEVMVTGYAGPAPPLGHVAILDPAVGGPPRHVALEDGRTAFLTRSATVDLEVWTVGYRTARLDAVRERATVDLEPGLPVTIRLAAAIDLPAAPSVLAVGAEPLLPDNRLYHEYVCPPDGLRPAQWVQWIQIADLPFGPAREVSLSLPGAGDYCLRWFLYPAGDDRTREFRGTRGQTELRATDAAGPLVLEWGPDPAAYAEAHARLAVAGR
ncbi:MAG: carboxypeptidase-like regulatory domain-containing protein [Planctomycetota bacterium]